MIEKTDYLNNLGRAKALLQFLKDDAVKYAAHPAAKKFVTERNQAKIKDLEEFIVSVIGYIQALEFQGHPITDQSGKVVHLYHYPKDEDTIKCLAITQCMSMLKSYVKH